MEHKTSVTIVAWYEAIWGKVRFNIDNQKNMGWTEAFHHVRRMGYNDPESLLRAAMAEADQKLDR